MVWSCSKFDVEIRAGNGDMEWIGSTMATGNWRVVEASLDEGHGVGKSSRCLKRTQADRGSSSACCRRHRHDYTSIQVSDSVYSLRCVASGSQRPKIPLPGRDIRY